MCRPGAREDAKTRDDLKNKYSARDVTNLTR